VVAELRGAGFRVELHEQNDKIGAKIRNATLMKVPYMLVIGDREKEAKQVAVRTLKGVDKGALSTESVIDILRQEIASKG
jgi:threonyl-tRNA synthetase